LHVDTEPARRFNRVVIDNFRAGRIYRNLASPVAGTGISASEFHLLALAAVLDGCGDEVPTAAKYSLAFLKRCGRLPMRDGTLIENDNEGIAFLEQQLQPILDDLVPIWRRLGVL
jgi:hypothetical protein